MFLLNNGRVSPTLNANDMKVQVKISVLALWMAAFPCFAWNPDGMSVKLRPAVGYQFENRVDYLTDIYAAGDLLLGVDSYICDGSPYASAYGYPSYGLGFSFTGMSMIELPQPSYFQDFYSMYMSFKRPLIRRGGFSAGYMLEFGPALSFGRYDPVDNPANCYVSSPLMIHFAGGLYAGWRFDERWTLSLDARLRHFSNGRISLPNQGLNMIEAGVGLEYHFVRDRTSGGGSLGDGTADFVRDADAGLGYDKGLAVHMGIGAGMHVTEAEWLAEKRSRPYPRFSFSADIMYRYALKFATGIGLDLFYAPDIGILEADERTVYGNEAVDAGVGYSPVSVGLSVVQEIYYRNFSAFVAVGIYPYSGMGVGNDISWNYQRAGLRYYVPKWGDMFFGIAVKAQDFLASEYMEFSVGFRL